MGAKTFHQLDVRQVIADGCKARVALGVHDAQRRALPLWSFGPDGKVVALLHFLDTAKPLAATRGEDTTAR